MAKSNLAEIRRKKPTKVLYHYTTTNGLLGIFKSKQLWCTSIHYFNDSTEFVYTLRLVKKKLEDLQNSGKSNLPVNMTSRLIKVMETLAYIADIYVFSLSEEGDLLSQWRGYCPQGNGFSIGFHYKHLEKQLKSQNYSLLECQYAPSIQSAILDELIGEYISKFRIKSKKGPLTDQELQNLNNGFAIQLVQIAPMMKHPSFREEKEWRLVSPMLGRHTGKICHRGGQTMILPYTKFDLKLDKDDTIEIQDIIVGPTQHPFLSLRSLQDLVFSTWDINVLNSRISEIPYRPL